MKRAALATAAALLATACARAPEALDVGIPLPASVPAGSFVLTVDYSGAGARPKSESGRPLCASVLPRGKVSFDDDGRGRLVVSVTTPAPLLTPLEVAACRMLPTGTEASAEAIGAALKVVLASTPSTGGQQRYAGLPIPATSSAHQDPPRPAAVSGEPPKNAPAKSEPARAQRPSVPWPDGSRPSAESMDATPRGVPAGTGESRRRPGKDPATPERRPESGAFERLPAAPASRPAQTNDALRSRQPAGDPVRAWAVTVGITTAAASPVAALQFDVIHSGASGSFVGRSQSVDCRILVDVALSTGNNQRQGHLTYALVDLAGFDTPADVIACTFKTRETPRMDSFDVKVVDAADANGSPLDLGMAVTDVRRLD